MMKNKKLLNRQSIRLKGYDYSSPGYYFITICVQDRKSLFGEIINGKIQLNEVGQMIQKWYQKLPEKFDHTINDAFICMPNHIHFITQIVYPDTKNIVSLSDIIQWFKTMTTNEYIRNVKSQNWPRFNKRLWQRNYWEHIIRNENSLNNICDYIYTNPQKWEQDRLHPNEPDLIQELSAEYQTSSWRVFA